MSASRLLGLRLDRSERTCAPQRGQTRQRIGSTSLRRCHEFEHMAVRVAKIDAAAAVPVVELTVVEAPRCAAIGDLRLSNAAEDSIELGITDMKGVVVALELLVVVEKERERVVDT